MIDFQKFTLSNGLRLIVHQVVSSPMIALDILYDIGSKDEDPQKTGYAHLFEHLMFCGSANANDYDHYIQLAGGENNAFTNSDYTNYYTLLPSNNLEIALWLESDRMKNLVINDKVLQTQKKVVIEEFKETTYHHPYGDVWHNLSGLAYTQHPYNWPTIGKDFHHIENARLDELNTFYQKYYRPNNAIIALVGNIDPQEAFDLTEKWFGNIKSGINIDRTLTEEPKQQEKREKQVLKDIPSPAMYLAFHMVDRRHPDFYAMDLLSDILAHGRSSRFFQKLYKEKKIFNQIDSYISGTIDPGLFIIEGKMNNGYRTEKGIEAIWEELNYVKEHGIKDKELEKITNQLESSLIFSEVNVLNKAISLAYFELLGDASLVNVEAEHYRAVKTKDIKRVANELFIDNNTTQLTYEIST